MDPKHILWPLLAQLTLSLLAYLKLVIVKARELKAGNVDLKAVALDQEAWPPSVRLVNNNIRNQFETPILFYVLCILLWGLGAVDTLAVSVAWIYAGSRVAHFVIHTGKNIVKYRFPMFSVGIAALVALIGLVVKALVA